MKKSFLLMLIVFLWTGVNSQTILYQDDFEAYAAESYLAVNNPTWWTTWENLPGTAQDAKIKTTFAHSTTKSFMVTTAGGSTDLLLKLGDRTSGSFELTWWMYVEAPNAAYYNVQHFESPGIQWAYDVYFYVNGSGALLVGGDSVNFNFPKATWFQVKQLLNLDEDSATLYINGALINQWPFHYTGNNTNGDNQLGAVDFFSESATYTYYVDDLTFTQLVAPTEPAIVVSPDSIGSWMAQGTNQTVPLMISDTGSTPLTYNVMVLYDSIPDLGLATDTGTLNYDTENANAIGFNSVPVTASVAARFLNNMTLSYAGMKIIAVEVYINELNTTGSNQMTVKIWDMGNEFEPGPVLYQQNFTPAATGWQTITLNTPVFVSGAEVWVGYTFTQTDAGIYIPGVDAGPADPNGDFLSTGVGWSHLSANPSLDANWNIRAKLQGQRIPHWLTVTPSSGTVDPNGTDTLQVMMENDTLTPGRYTGALHITSNDPLNEAVHVPVVLDVVGVGVGEKSGITTSVYPNPAVNKLTIVSSEKINSYKVIDLNGRTVVTGAGNSPDISSLPSGMYVLQAVTVSGTSTLRFVKR